MHLEDNMAKAKQSAMTAVLSQVDNPPIIVPENKQATVIAPAPKTKLVQKSMYCLITPKRVVISNFVHLPYAEAVTKAKAWAVEHEVFVTIQKEQPVKAK
jgi:hypothetical protein